jgi:hypothetical protein
VKAVYGLYADGNSAQQAVNRLRAAGLADRQITILSAQPMEDFEFGHIDKRSWMWWIACGGGLVGMAAAFGLTWLTEMSWPINVGGLPIYAWWPAPFSWASKIPRPTRSTMSGRRSRAQPARASRRSDA